jgi:hypothetical protein
MTKRLGQNCQDRVGQHRTDRVQPGLNIAERIARKGQLYQDQQKEQPEWDRQNRIGLTKLPGQDCLNRAASTGLPG